MECRIAEGDIYRYFQAEFQPIYADLVVVLGEKPSQITFQIDAAFSHMAVAHSHPEARDLNLQRALAHLHRAELDAAKLLWLHKKRELSALVEDADIRRFCTNHPESELLRSKRPAKYILSPSCRESDHDVRSMWGGAASWVGGSAVGTSGKGWWRVGRVAA
jgi:hypothetical protein